MSQFNINSTVLTSMSRPGTFSVLRTAFVYASEDQDSHACAFSMFYWTMLEDLGALIVGCKLLGMIHACLQRLKAIPHLRNWVQDCRRSRSSEYLSNGVKLMDAAASKARSSKPSSSGDGIQKDNETINQPLNMLEPMPDPQYYDGVAIVGFAVSPSLGPEGG